MHYTNQRKPKSEFYILNENHFVALDSVYNSVINIQTGINWCQFQQQLF